LFDRHWLVTRGSGLKKLHKSIVSILAPRRHDDRLLQDFHAFSNTAGLNVFTPFPVSNWGLFWIAFSFAYPF
jgi:hypothetical protein